VSSPEPTHDGEGLDAAWLRLRRDIRQPLTRHPQSRGRRGWRDVVGGHALVNVVVEGTRRYPQTVAKGVLLGALANALLLAAVAWDLAL
jgi:hypothetical protein